MPMHGDSRLCGRNECKEHSMLLAHHHKVHSFQRVPYVYKMKLLLDIYYPIAVLHG